MWCESLQHRNCAKISDIVLSDLPSNIVFFCMQCFHKLPSAIKAHNNVQEMFSLLEKRLESVETLLANKFSSMNDQVTKILETNYTAAIESQITKITGQNQATISNLTSKVDKIVEEVSTNSTKLGSLKDQLENLEAPVTTMLTDEDTTTVDPASPLGNNSVNSITIGVVDEQREREKRKLNLIFHNVAESTKPDGMARKNDDISFIKTLLHDHIGIEPSISNALRIGKKSDKTRLLKVSVSSTQEKSSILSKCYMLRNSSNPTGVQKIFATPDLTPLEQKKDKVLRQKLAEMNKDGKTYRIKNGKIVRRA